MAYNLGYVNGSLAGCKSIGSFFFHDVDCYDRDNSEQTKALILAKKDEIGLKALEQSAGGGWHIICQRVPGTTILENQVRVASILHLEMDTNAKDLQRVCYSTSGSTDDLPYLDDALFTEPMTPEQCGQEYINLKERECNGLELLPQGAKQSNKHYRPWEETATGELGIDNESPVLEQLDNKELSEAKLPNDEISNVQGTQLDYLGLPYADIIKKWWELYNEGKEPVKSNRDVLTFELAVNLRHICGFDRGLMGRVIPCYDGFLEAQKMKCIDSALAEKRTQLPKRLKDVLYEVRRDMKNKSNDDMADGQRLEEVESDDQLSAINAQLSMMKMPMGIKESISAVGSKLAMPVITAVCPAIGALATGVELDIHGQKKGLNLISYIAGDFASGKGQIDPVVDAWMGEVTAHDKMYQMQEDEWRTKMRAAKNKKEQPEEPKLPVRCLTLNNTVANLAERLANTEGKHAFSFTPEADTVAQKWKSTMSDFSIMLRQSYDGTRYDREARSAEAVNVHIDRLLWNVTMCGTPDALYRVVNNYTDGFQSRIAVARTPDNTFAPLEDKPSVLHEKQRDRIQQVAHLLMLMQGDIELPKLEAKGREWVERIRLETMKNDDKVMARQRFRVCVTAQRMTCCLMLCKVCETLIQKHGLGGAETRLKQFPNLWKELLLKTQTPQMLEVYDVIADSLLENALYFFRDRIENAFNSRDYAGNLNGVRLRRSKNDSIYERLDHQFTYEQALQHSVALKGAGVTRNSIQQMLKNWRKQGLIILTDDGKFVKQETVISQ
ncbi:MAG: DUF3987 domain-containing protein [Bacteroidaceae bacterium]|nr:DUF3987 domain-containing protein [Bacteroidaceae bacterium]